MILFRNVYNFGISKDLFSLTSLRKNHGNEEITVIVQESNTSGFSVKSSKKEKIKLKEYTKMMTSSINPDKKIRFGVNIDFGD